MKLLFLMIQVKERKVFGQLMGEFGNFFNAKVVKE